MIRVAHVVSHPIQYFAPLYRALATRNELSLTVMFYRRASGSAYFDPGFDRLVEWDIPLTDGYSSVDISASSTLGTARTTFSALARGQFDVVWVHGYAHAAAVASWIAAHARGIPLVIREDQTLLAPRSRARRSVKALVLRPYFAGAYGLAIGHQNRRFFRHYGMPESRVFSARYCVDNGFFSSRALTLARERRAIRRGFGITDEAPVILFVGRLAPEKNITTLLEAFTRLSPRHPAWLLMVGDGELRGFVPQTFHNRVLAPGFLNQTELPRAYAASDIFVLPSLREPWGLVVNEAMNFGLPLVLSDGVGCSADLLRDGWNGFIFQKSRADELTDRLSRLVESEDLRGAMGERSKALVAEYDIDACANEIVDACMAVAGHRSHLRLPMPRRRAG